MDVTVTDIDWDAGKSRRAEVSLTDTAGNSLGLVDYEGANISINWERNHRYRISRCGINKSQVEEQITLTPSKKTKITPFGKADQTSRILVIGDTHVGYRHRDQSDKPSWGRDTNDRQVFIQCLERAREMEIDAVVHAGDVFDHYNTKGDRKAVGQEIARTVESGVPFYYLHGNHDNKKGKKLLDTSPGIHLTEDAATVGNPSANFFGVDHSGDTFPSEAPGPSIEMLPHPTMLVMHDTPHPVVDRGGNLLYQNDNNKSDVSGFLQTAIYDIDLIIAGHLHVAKQGWVRDTDVPVLVTGSTIPISKYDDQSRPSSWLLTVTDDGIDLDRQPL